MQCESLYSKKPPMGIGEEASLRNTPNEREKARTYNVDFVFSSFWDKENFYSMKTCKWNVEKACDVPNELNRECTFGAFEARINTLRKPPMGTDEEASLFQLECCLRNTPHEREKTTIRSAQRYNVNFVFSSFWGKENFYSMRAITVAFSPESSIYEFPSSTSKYLFSTKRGQDLPQIVGGLLGALDHLLDRGGVIEDSTRKEAGEEFWTNLRFSPADALA